MRWPWSRHHPPLPPLEDEDVDMSDSADAVARAREALDKAKADSDTMHRITKAIHAERQANNFSGAMFRAMRRKES